LTPFEPNVGLCRQRGRYRNVWHQVLPSALEGRWDTVLAVEILEHLPQDAAVQQRSSSRASRRAGSSSRCRGTRWSASAAAPTRSAGFNEFEAHKSSLPTSFFRDRGYTVRGADLAQKALERMRLTATLTSLTFRLPRLAATIVRVPRRVAASRSGPGVGLERKRLARGVVEGGERPG